MHLIVCRHDSMDLMWRSGDLGMFGSTNTQVFAFLLLNLRRAQS